MSRGRGLVNPVVKAWLGRVALVLAGILLGLIVGLYVDQRFPAEVPFLGGSQAGQVDNQEALRILRENYYDGHLDYGRLKQGSIQGMVASLGDPYSAYRSPDQYQQAKSSLNGECVCIGITPNFQSGRPVVGSVVAGSPAAKAGLMAGDVIVKIDAHDTQGLSQDQVSSLIKGPEGKLVTLTIQRGDQALTFPIVRARLTLPSVRWTKLEGGVLYVRIYQFGDHTIDQLDQALKSGLPESGAILLDLRDNGGGLVDVATDVISRFVDHGDAFLLRHRDGRVTHQGVRGEHPASGKPLAVLVNGNTASASEIVAGAVRIDRQAQLVGEKTFGKGSVQVDFILSDGGDLHLTIEHWLLPNGDSVNQKGLTPDVQAHLSASTDMFDPSLSGSDPARDSQLAAGLHLLAGAQPASG